MQEKLKGLHRRDGTLPVMLLDDLVFYGKMHVYVSDLRTVNMCPVEIKKRGIQEMASLPYIGVTEPYH